VRSTKKPEPGRLHLMWAWVGVVVMTVVAVTVFWLDEGVTQVVVAAALTVCLAMVAVARWLDRRAGRSVERVDQRD